MDPETGPEGCVRLPVVGYSWSPVGVRGTMRGADRDTPLLREPHSELEDYAQPSAVWGTVRINERNVRI